MGRARGSPKTTKTKVSVTLDHNLLAWLEARTGPGKEFSTVSHGVERGIALLRERDELEDDAANALLATIVERHRKGDAAGVAQAAAELHKAKTRKATPARSRTATSEK